MNAPRKITLRLTALALVATTSYVLANAGCGGTNNSNPMPTQHDSGTDSTMGHPDGGGCAFQPARQIIAGAQDLG